MKVFLATVLLTVIFTADGTRGPQILPHGGDESEHEGGVNLQIIEKSQIYEEDISYLNGNSIEKSRGCVPTISCTRAGGQCVRKRNKCNGTVDASGCRGGKKCKCCIPGGCVPTISCTRAGGQCVKKRNKCNGTVDASGCKGGKKCKCCIPDHTTQPPLTCPTTQPSCTCPTCPTTSDHTTQQPLTCPTTQPISICPACPTLTPVTTTAPAHVEIDFSNAKIGQTSSYSGDYTAEKAFLSTSPFYCSARGLPQAIWVSFAVPVPVVKYSFQGRTSSSLTVTHGPTKYVFFGSNSADCSDNSSWVHLVEDNSGTPFTQANTPKTELVPGNKKFTCYGFYVTAVGGGTDGTFVCIDNIKLYTTAHVGIDFSHTEFGQTSIRSDYSAEKAFLPLSKYWHADNGLPQAIWVGFAAPVQVVKFSFQSRTDLPNDALTVQDGPSKYVFFGSNATDCSDKSAWTYLVEDHSGTPFTQANTPKTELVPGNKKFTCYGFYVTQVPGRTDGRSAYVTMDNIKLYTTGIEEMDLDNIGAKATSSCCGEVPERAFVHVDGNAPWWQSTQGVFPKTPQSIWYQFPVEVVVAGFSFQSRTDSHITGCGPSSYEVFGSNAADCSDQSSWVTLFEDHNIRPFTKDNNLKSGYIRNPAPYRCYGIKALTIPSNYGSSIMNIKFFRAFCRM